VGVDGIERIPINQHAVKNWLADRPIAVALCEAAQLSDVARYKRTWYLKAKLLGDLQLI
jgi:hypothetical protein